MKRIITKFLSILCLSSILAIAGCQREDMEVKDFRLYYAGLTNIGPNMGAVLTPHYFGGEPGDFRISGVTFEGAAYSGPEFTVDPQTGKLTVTGYRANPEEGTVETPAGEYLISIACKVNGKEVNFKDVITVTFFKGIPEGITVTPAEHEIQFNDLAEGTTATLPTSQVTTEGEHIAITGYRIANVRFGEEVIDNTMTPMFSISDKGEISIIKGNNFSIGTYIIDLKLNTASYDNDPEIGLFAEALKINVVSKPLSFSYTPDSGDIEEEDQTHTTSFRSQPPILMGSDIETEWSIAKVEPETDKITIDPLTGIISIAEGHGFVKDMTYKIDVCVRNKYSDEGEVLSVAEAYSINVVAYIPPIENFSYAQTSKKLALAWSVLPDASTTGVKSYSWAEPEAEYVKHLNLDESTGAVSALKGNSLAVGNYEIKIKGKNGKEGGDVTASLNFTIDENPYYITDFSYGNNLDLTEAETDGVSQFRYVAEDALVAAVLEIKYGDVLTAQGVTYSFAGKNALNGNNTSLNAENGKISFIKNDETSPWKSGGLGVAFITAKTQDPDDTDNTFSVTRPIFIDYADEIDKVSITYTPFVLRVNPKEGGRSVVPVITTSDSNIDVSKILLDYRRAFNWYNLEGVDSNGNPHVSGALADGTVNFLSILWDEFTNKTGLNKNNKNTGIANYGGKTPVSFYNGNNDKTPEQLDASPAYVDNSAVGKFGSLVVKPGLWKYENYADGVFHGQITFTTDGNVAKINNGSKIFPIAIWLDKDFVK